METIFSPKPDAIKYHSFTSAGYILRDVKATTAAPFPDTCKAPRSVKEVLDSPHTDDIAYYQNVKMPDAPSIEMVPYTHARELLWVQDQNIITLENKIREQASTIAQRDEMIHQLQQQCQALTIPQAQEPRQGEIDDLQWRLSVEQRRLKTVKEERDDARTRCSELRHHFLGIHKRYWQLRKDVHTRKLEQSGSIHKMDRLEQQLASRDNNIAKLQHEVAQMQQLLNFYCVDEYADSEDDDTRLSDTSDDGASDSNTSRYNAGEYPPARINLH
ncbi:hypothetical protein MPER_10165, partial [Moniliophthora perniciosa FA553]